MFNLTTPLSIDDHIQTFLKELPTNCPPVYLTPQPDSWAVKQDCFGNVKRKIFRDGGSLQHGWVIWYLPGLFLDAEFHGVWKSPTGDLIDITPPVDGERQILFVPDNNTVYNGRIIPNIKKPIIPV